MSARHDAQTMHRAFEAGGTFFLIKPLDRWRLSRLLRSTSGIMLRERRRYWRIPLSAPLHCAVGSKEYSGYTVRNLSTTGMLLRGDGSLSPKTDVYLAFALSQNERSLVSARGRVVRVDDNGQAGVRFTHLSSTDHRRILERIATESDNA
jgi:c-di-GMP-binding flagellar brake protein YcgR